LPPTGYPMELRTIGDHIRRHRLDLGLLQVEVATEVGVTESTVWNWEHGTEPELAHIPAVIDFLGYVPWEEPKDSVGRLAHFKRISGLSYERLGKLMGRDPEQLAKWITQRHKPCASNLRDIESFLSQKVIRKICE
jgi:transcriptional regulator with XRE-family HTH domain